LDVRQVLSLGGAASKSHGGEENDLSHLKSPVERPEDYTKASKSHVTWVTGRQGRRQNSRAGSSPSPASPRDQFGTSEIR
jgi:hypothetical protein